MKIKEIAELSGYSVATVSRVLNNDKKVKSTTREKVQKVISDNNYIPNISAKNLRIAKSKTILVVIKSIRNTVLLDIIDGICEKLSENSYNVNLHIPNKTDDADYYKFLLKSKAVDGIIFIASSISREAYAQLKDEKVIMCSEYFADFDMEKISIDHTKAAIEITDTVLSKGCKNIRYIRGNRISNSMIMREKGIRQSMEQQNIKVPDNLVEVNEKKGIEFENFIKEYLTHNEDIDCIMLHTGDRVLEAKKAIGDMKKNIKLVSFDDIYSLSFIRPKVLRISSDNKKIGTIAGELIVKKIHNLKYSKIHTLDYTIKK